MTVWSDKLQDEEVLEAIQTLMDKGVTIEMLEQWYREKSDEVTS